MEPPEDKDRAYIEEMRQAGLRGKSEFVALVKLIEASRAIMWLRSAILWFGGIAAAMTGLIALIMALQTAGGVQ